MFLVIFSITDAKICESFFFANIIKKYQFSDSFSSQHLYPAIHNFLYVIWMMLDNDMQNLIAWKFIR